MQNLSSHSLISSRNCNFSNHLEMYIETEGSAFLRPNGGVFQSCICSNALCWRMPAGSVDLVSPSSAGPPGDLHFKLCCQLLCWWCLASREPHMLWGPLESLFSLQLHHWKQRDSFFISLPNPPDSVYFGTFNLQP